ncbi:hypothetical protein CgunFtcFv8_017677 [Champsocephalus gunnari]|uniref:Uncharacterized protein n=1 Tax=Champsocephalus gunnari TaxID=52237 RepID=A0AAN8DR27_CHAGU|nr:hypothetical protein CgunFtcFv8_017677 [Champsocephalus gunnari]
MKAVVRLLVLILGVSHGLETHCDGRQDGAQCFETSTAGNWPIMAGVLSALVLLLVVGVAVVCAQRKKTSNQPTDEDEQELTYAVVKIKQRSRRQLQQRAEPDVEYGQVKFSERPPPTADPTGEECVYAKVQRGR